MLSMIVGRKWALLSSRAVYLIKPLQIASANPQILPLQASHRPGVRPSKFLISALIMSFLEPYP